MGRPGIALSVTVFVSVASTLVSCGAVQRGVKEPSSAPHLLSETNAPSERSESRSDDDLWCGLSKQFPGFAGAVVDPEEGELRLLFADGSPKIDPESVKQALKHAGFDARGRPVVRRVIFDFCQLKKWSDRLSPQVLTMDGVVMSGIDESRNRLVFGVVDLEKSTTAIRREARRHRIPLQALLIQEMESFTVGG